MRRVVELPDLVLDGFDTRDDLGIVALADGRYGELSLQEAMYSRVSSGHSRGGRNESAVETTEEQRRGGQVRCGKDSAVR